MTVSLKERINAIYQCAILERNLLRARLRVLETAQYDSENQNSEATEGLRVIIIVQGALAKRQLADIERLIKDLNNLPTVGETLAGMN